MVKGLPPRPPSDKQDSQYNFYLYDTNICLTKRRTMGSVRAHRLLPLFWSLRQHFTVFYSIVQETRKSVRVNF